MNSIFRFKLITAVLLICFSLVFCISTLSYAEETVDTNNAESISQNTSTTSNSSKISKNSDTYKILVALTVISIIVVIIIMRGMIISLMAYFFIISSIIWTIYSAIPLFTKKSLELSDFNSVGLGIMLTVISFVILHILNGNNSFGSGMKSDKGIPSSKDEYNLLLKRARIAFLTLKKELSQGKLDKTSAFTSDELFEQISINLDAMKAENYLIVYDDLRIKKIEVKKKAVENHFNNLYIEIQAFGTRYKSNIDTKRIIEGSEVSGEFTEIFCLSRKAGCQAASKGLIEGVCPRCGTPIKGKRTNTCIKCNNELRSGEFDVVLRSISYPN